MGRGVYHVMVMLEMNLRKIIESNPLTWHNARAYVFKYGANFDICKADACIGNLVVIMTFFPGLPKQWEVLSPGHWQKYGREMLGKNISRENKLNIESQINFL